MESKATYELTIRADVRKKYPGGGWSGESLSMDGQTVVECENFVDMARMLERFGAMAEAIKEEAGKPQAAEIVAERAPGCGTKGCSWCDPGDGTVTRCITSCPHCAVTLALSTP